MEKWNIVGTPNKRAKILDLLDKVNNDLLTLVIQLELENENDQFDYCTSSGLADKVNTLESRVNEIYSRTFQQGDFKR